MTAKAHIYAEDGALLGFIAYSHEPPKILDLEGRTFEQRAVWTEDSGDGEVACFDYWEILIEEPRLDIIEICVGCGRNASLFWHKCCPAHISLDTPDVYCQACVEQLHPNDPEFARI